MTSYIDRMMGSTPPPVAMPDGTYRDFMGREITYEEAQMQMIGLQRQAEAQAQASSMDQSNPMLQMNPAGAISPVPVDPVFQQAMPGATINPYAAYSLDPKGIVAKQFAPAAAAGVASTVLSDPRLTREGRRLYGRGGEQDQQQEMLDKYQSGEMSGREFLEQQDPGVLQAIEEASRQASSEVAASEREAYGKLAGATEGTSVAQGIGQVAAGAARARAQTAMQSGQMMADAIGESVSQAMDSLQQLRAGYGEIQAGVRAGYVQTLTSLMGMLGKYHGIQPTEFISPYTVGALLSSYEAAGMSPEEAKTKLDATFQIAGNDAGKQRMINAFLTDPLKSLYQNLRGADEGEALPVTPAAGE